METNYHREIAQIQDTAQRAYEESQHRLLQMEDRNRELLAIIESQSQALESQKDEQRTLMNHVGSLQSEVTMLRHSSAQYDVQVQDQNGAVDVPGLMQMMNSLKDEIKVLKGKHTRKKKHESYVDGRVAVPPEQALSACAGYPPSQDPSPAHSMHSRHSKEPQKPVTAPQMFSLSTYSYFGDASTIGLPGKSNTNRDKIHHPMTHPCHLHRPVIGMEVEGDHLIVEGDHLMMTVQHRPDLGD
jgi:hypothetical protein